MRNKLRLLAAAFTVLYCSVAFSLGMGELDLKSNLNQRFDAEIVLTGVGNLGTDEIIASLATQADFDRIGADRNYQLIDLRFATRVREDGQYIVHVTSTKPIIEPFLNFIVEAIWPNGRILREFTVLLDPPVFGTKGIEKIEPGVSSAAAADMNNDDSARASNQRRKVPAAPTVSTGRTEGVITQADEYGMTGPGDTLWAIALKVRPTNNVSVQQTMLALQRANPDAFINNNINLLKAGHVLRIPDMQEIRAETPSSAIAEVKTQNEEFQDYRISDVAQMDARRTSRREQASSDDGGDGELKLLAAERDGEGAGANGARAAELENGLAVAREDLDRARRANAEMNVRLDDLAGQVETLNEIVKLKDDQLAALRAELQKMQNAGSSQTQPVSATQTQQSASLLSNPMVLGGVGVLLIGGIVAALIMLRKRRQAESDIEEDDFQPMLMADDEPSLAAAEDQFSSADTDTDDDEDNDVTPQTSDVIGEAEIYIAYGRFPQAISFLQNAIENEPDRSDIQVKLLEVYVQTEDATAFNLQLEQLKNLGDEEATAKALELQSHIPGAAETAAAAMDATIVSSEPIQAIEEPEDDDDDLSFDLDDLDAETAADSLDLADDDGDELSLDEAMELGDAELELDLDAADDSSAAGAADTEDELDLDLDDGLDLDLEDDGLGDAGEGELDLSSDDELDLGEDLDLSDELSLDDDEVGADLDATLKLDDNELDLGGADDLDATVELADDELGLGDDSEIALELGDDDEIELDLGDDDAIELDLGDDDDDAFELDLGDDDDDVLDLGSDTELDLDDDGAIELDLDDDGLDLGDLGDLEDSDFDDDDDLGELNLDEDASSKLDLARAYIEMGDSDGAKSLLDEVVSEGDDGQIAEAKDLLGKL